MAPTEVCSGFVVDEVVYDALRAGASGFLLKDTPPADLLAAIRVVAAGEALLAPSVTRRLIAEFARRPEPSPVTPAALASLTDRALRERLHRASTTRVGQAIGAPVRLATPDRGHRRIASASTSTSRTAAIAAPSATSTAGARSISRVSQSFAPTSLRCKTFWELKPDCAGRSSWPTPTPW